MYQKKVIESKFLGVWGEGWMRRWFEFDGVVVDREPLPLSEGGRKGTPLLYTWDISMPVNRVAPRATQASSQGAGTSTRAMQASPPIIHTQPVFTGKFFVRWCGKGYRPCRGGSGAGCSGDACVALGGWVMQQCGVWARRVTQVPTSHGYIHQGDAT